MKKFKVTIVAITLLLFSSNLFGAGLKGIEIGEDLNSGCEKLKQVYKEYNKAYKKNVIIKLHKNECGNGGLIGLTSADGKTISKIELPIHLFGLSMFDGAKSHADNYVNSKDAAVFKLERQYIKADDYEYYDGYNLMGDIYVKIDILFISMSKPLVKPQVNFN